MNLKNLLILDVRPLFRCYPGPNLLSVMARYLKPMLVTLLLCSSTFGFGQVAYNQQQNFLKANSNWVFGDSARIDFNTTTPTVSSSNISSLEGAAAVSHPETGALLFYSNGAKCWKANGDVMDNGDGLLGNQENGKTATQGVRIVPFINDINRYYLFSLSDVENPNSLYYSVVDMNMDNGEGDIDPTQKNILLNATSLSEAMVAIPGECNDVWLMLHSARNPEFIAYHITSEGIDTVPVLTTLGNAITESGAVTYHRMAVSSDRQKIAINSSSLSDHITFVAEFDPANGVVSNLIEVMGITAYRVPPFIYAREPGYGLCFSPDNTKLYVSATVMGNFFMTDPKNRLYQFDVSNHDSTAIVSSRYSVYENNVGMYANGVDLKLYNDTVYICVKGTASADQINRINNPNVSGVGCNYEMNVLNAAPGIRFYNMFGSDVVFPLPVDTMFQVKDTARFCTGSSVFLAAPSIYEDYLWSDGSTDSTLEVAQADTYWVSYRDSCYDLYIDTFFVEELPFIAPEIQLDGFTLSTTETYDTYQWLLDGVLIDGATDSAYTATSDGDYQVIVSNEFGCSDTSAVHTIQNTGIGVVGALANAIRLYPNPTREEIWIKAPYPVNIKVSTMSGRVISTYNAIRSLSTSGLRPGMYFVTISDAAGKVIKVEKLIKAAP